MLPAYVSNLGGELGDMWWSSNVLQYCMSSISTVWTDTFYLFFKTAAPSEQKLVVVSVSPQSRASLAVRCKLSVLETAKKLTAFLKSLGKCGNVFC